MRKCIFWAIETEYGNTIATAISRGEAEKLAKLWTKTTGIKTILEPFEMREIVKKPKPNVRTA